jgi:hypothetical protein
MAAQLRIISIEGGPAARLEVRSAVPAYSHAAGHA